MSQTCQDEKFGQTKREGDGARDQSVANLGPENEGNFYNEDEERRFTRIPERQNGYSVLASRWWKQVHPTQWKPSIIPRVYSIRKTTNKKVTAVRTPDLVRMHLNVYPYYFKPLHYSDSHCSL
jgi:hypothetical protein